MQCVSLSEETKRVDWEIILGNNTHEQYRAQGPEQVKDRKNNIKKWRGLLAIKTKNSEIIYRF